MTIDQRIALASSIAGAMASLIALLTLIEMSRQRRSTYRPDIVIMRETRFTLQWVQELDHDLSLPTGWVSCDEGRVIHDGMNGIQEVVGSIPFRSTNSFPDTPS